MSGGSGRHVFPLLLVVTSIATIAVVLYFMMAYRTYPASTENVIIEARNLGRIKGLKFTDGAAVFYGLPFSLPPVGDYRWQKPRPWTEKLAEEGHVFDASYTRPACPQLCALPSARYTCPTVQSEDCLHVTVYTPSSMLTRIDNKYHEMKNEEKLPVMVFLHGGAFISGSNSIPLYDGRFMSEKGGVVLVMVNYRLGPFGFFYQDTKFSDAITGNFGLWDQVEALKWVQKHISNFGGDPKQVTIFGQSAGGQSVLAHMVNEYSDPLFARAIAESGPFGLTFKTKEEAQVTADNFVKENGKCVPNDVGCLRKLSTEEILDSVANFSIAGQFNPSSLSQVAEPWSPILDNDILHEQLYYTFLKNNQQKKPLITGTTSDEGMYFVAQITTDPMSKAVWSAVLRLIFPTDVIDSINDHLNYKCILSNCDYRLPFNDLVTEYMFICPNRYTLKENRENGLTSNIWWYLFTQVWSFPAFWEEYDECYDLPCHSADLPYIFDLDVLTDFRFTPEEQHLSDVMIKYWTNFAKSGNPNQPDSSGIGGDAYWPRLFDGSSESNTEFKMMELNGQGPTMFVDGLASRCDFWDGLGLYLNDSIKIGPAYFKEIQKTIQELKTEPLK